MINISHFTVLVIGDYYEDQLVAYNENMEVAPYKVYLDEQDVKNIKERYGVGTPKEIVLKIEDWFGSKGNKDSKGFYRWSTYNPKSKWDWYSLGGRWLGYFKLKEGARGVLGECGTGDNKPKYDADQALKKDIDFEYMKQASIKEATKDWKKFIYENRDYVR